MEKSHDNVISVDFSLNKKRKSPANPKREVPIKNLEKLRIFERYLEHGIVSVAFNPRPASVIVPHQFKTEKTMALNFSYRFHIDDFKFDSEGMGATLTFENEYFFCYLPWEHVFSIFSEKLQNNSVWPDNPRRPHLTLLDDE